jgi:photosystem II stability/assembly factor-like uncharacterized protein
VGTARGVFASRNGGDSWHTAGLDVPNGPFQVTGARITSLAVDPRAPATVYAARSLSTDGGFTVRQELFKSTDGGKRWRSLRMEAGEVAVSPADPATVYVITGLVPAKTNRLFRSTNGGRTWQPADRQRASTRFWALAFDPTRATTVYAATAQGVLRSKDGGTGWQRGTDALSRREAFAVAVDPRDPETVYAGTDGGVIKSLDGGHTWRVVNTVMGSHGRDRSYGQVSSLVVDPHDSRTVYATARCAGIFKSSDGGRTWRSANAVRDRQCQDTPLALAARAPRTVYAAYAWRGVFKSSDGAVRWHATNTGLNLTTVSSLVVDPSRPETVYASTGQPGLFKSSDGGAHWRPVARGLVAAVALDPQDPRIVLAAGAPPRIIRSTDAGRAWRPNGARLATTPVALAISGDNAYAATARGVYTSSDGGRSWREPVTPPKSNVQALAVAPDDPTVVYAAAGGSDTRGLYESTDAGRTWGLLTDGLEDTDVSAVALDPERRTTIYIGTTGEGVFTSTDGGASWQPAGSGLPRIRIRGTTVTGKATSWTETVGITALAIDPANPKTLYAATSGRGVFRTRDAGRSWQPFNTGLAVLDVRSLAVDATGRALYAGTAGGGVVALGAGTN